MAKKKSKSKHDFRITNYGIANQVTGTSVLVEVDNTKILFDFGLFQSSKYDITQTYNINSRKFAVEMSELDFVLVSHAHIDHSGMLPILAQKQNKFNGKIITTEPTLPLMKINLHDGAFVQQQECKAHNKRKPNKPLVPLYSDEDVYNLMHMVRGYGFDEKIYLTDKLYIEFLHNAHMFGSASILLTYIKDEYTQKQLLFTGDISYKTKSPQPFTKQFGNRKLSPNVVITESTYGNRLHQPCDIVEVLAKHIRQECIVRKRKLFIPAFAIQRSSQIIYYLKKVHERYPDINEANIPIYLCGKMTNNAHNVIGNQVYKNYIDENWHEGYSCFEWGRVKKIDSFDKVESEVCSNDVGIVVASSGMLSGGNSVYIAEQLLPRQNVAFLACGFMGVATTGRAVLDTVNKSKKEVTIQGKRVRVKCHVLEPISLSGHGDANQLTQLIKDCDHKKLQCVILIHGEDESKEELKMKIESALGWHWVNDNNGKQVAIQKPKEIIKI